MHEYNICYSLDSTYAEQLAVSITSILQNANEDDNINFYILDGGLTISDKNKIRLLSNIKSFNIHYIDIDNEDFADCPLLKEKDEQYNDYHVTLPTYYRFKLSDCVPNLDKILYLDCDVIVRSSLEELYDTDITDYAAAMVIDAESDKEAQRLGIDKYFNAGVMLINLDYCKQNEVEKALFEYAKSNKDTILWQDQDIINVVLKDKIKEISNKWNFQYFQYENVDSKTLPECNIVHLAGRFKPWLMAFEHVLYDMYYHYLGFTAWKNKEIEYKLNSAGKYLKDNIGGRNTNIVVMTTDKDLQDTYKELDNAYSYVQSVEKTISSNTNTKLSKVYDEIQKSYEFVKDSIKDVEFKNTTEMDDKISKVYDEIQNTYDFVKNSIKDSEFKNTTEINEKISQIYFEIKKTYEFIKDSIKDSEYKTETNINEKVTLIYDEIKKAYEFISSTVKDSTFNLQSGTNERISEIYSEIEKVYEFIKNTKKDVEYRTETEINSKIEKVYEEITNAYEFVKKCQKEIEYNTSIESDNKIALVYEEITKNYKYTEKLNNEVKSIIKETENKILNNTGKAYQIRELEEKYENLAKNTEIQNSLFEQILSDKIESTVNKTQEHIDNVYDELDKANKYAEYLVEYTADKQEQKINKAISEVINIVDNVKADTENKIEAKSNELYAYTDNQIKNLQDFIKSENISLSAQLSRENSAQYSELYTYTNEQQAKIFKEISETSTYIENTLNNKIYDLYKNNETINYEINNLKSKIDEKPDSNAINRAIGELKNNISEKDYEYSQNLANIRNDFENKINQQRIKYENKLIAMENQLAQMNKKLKDMKKNPIDRFLDKFKNKSEKRK